MKKSQPIIHKSRQWLRPAFEFKRGEVLRIAYLNILGLRIRRRVVFVGLCLFVTKESFCVSNTVNGTAVTYTFRWPSPCIFNISKVKSYKFLTRTAKVSDRRLHLIFRTHVSDFIPESQSSEINPTEWKILPRYKGIYRRFYINDHSSF